MVVEISDWNDLDNVRNDLTADYVLVNDLDSDTAGYTGIGDDFEPIGDEGEFDGMGVPFEGTFNGDGFAIEDLVIDFQERAVGLFGEVDNADALIENLSVSGSVSDGGANDFRTAGLVGKLSGGKIQNCVSHVDITASNERSGGLVGQNDGTLTDSYATGSVEGNEEVGGLVGQNRTGTIQTSYAVGLVTGNTDVGGLVGFNDVDDGATVTDSYWDTETTGQSTSDGGTGLTTAEMQGSEAETNMDGFDFANVWDSVIESDSDASADGYPILIAVDREDQLDAQGILEQRVDITGQITLDETGVDTADVIVFNLTNNEFGGKTETDTEGNYTLTVEGTEDGSGDTIAIAVDFDDGTDRYGRLVTTVLE